MVHVELEILIDVYSARGTRDHDLHVCMVHGELEIMIYMYGARGTRDHD